VSADRGISPRIAATPTFNVRGPPSHDTVAVPRRSTRAVLALGVLVGLGTLVALPLTRPEQVGLATRVYTVAAEAALAGQPFYGVAPPGLEGYYFVYPPVVMLAVLPYGLLGDALLAFAIQTAVTVAAGVALAWLLVAAVDRAGIDLLRADRALIAAFTLVSVHATPTLVNGQLNVVLGCAVAAGFLALERERSGLAGAALAAAATVKLFPAAFGAYLLRRRAWRAVAAAIATGLGLLAIGVLAFGPDATVTYLTTVVPSEVQTGALAAAPLSHGFLTVRRQLAALLPWLDPQFLPLVGVLVVAPLVAATYYRLETTPDRWLAILATVIGTLLVLPLEGLYFPLAAFPLVPLLYVLPGGRTRQLVLAGTVLTMVQVTPTTLSLLADGGLVGPWLGDLVAGVARPVFRVILPATVGMWLLLAAGVHWQLTGREAGADDDRASVAEAN